MNLSRLFTLLVLVILISGCSAGNNLSSTSSTNTFENVTEGLVNNEQFTFRVYSEKAVYQVGEPLKIKAELTYIGDSESITISHAASPIWLLTTNLTEDYQFEAAMNEPLILTELNKDEPYIESYQFSGSSYYDGAPGKPYSEEVFMKMAEGNFPPGQYEIKGRTDFAIGDEIMNDRVSLETSIVFTIIE
ncbi:MAG TPA: hypothetical protein VNR38_09700 [Ureibacillus sp.]|nr:hypothetical protein [Ureibacillus sp.]